ncbi:unnamed protein product [Paramecium primaurelia]|uniref:Transmembrane protein n=1 Tax=Paramecium primaurelia TaxID=5886 RepID=A0A8S1PCD3_PARPR|nr:unnamed protein product [Paramecium primaurelia]
MTNSQNKQLINVLVYCNYISNHAPLKALIKLILQQADNIYFKQSFNNLSLELYQRAKQYQREAIHKNTIRSTNEHQSSLNVQSAYMTSHSSYILFPILIETIQSKINFWSKLINGYQDIDHYLLESLKTTQKMLLCKKEIEQRFDMINNKLKSQQQPDILTLRIIQIYYSGIYSNAFQAYQIEKSIEELIKNERYKQDETLDNMQLIQNRLIILKSSLVRKRGELINLNVRQLALFLNENEDSLKGIKHCNQLMPNFISSIHEKLMDNYLQRGYSKLMINGEATFCQNITGYIEQCSLNLFNFFDDKDDFILNMIITKQQSNNEIILFGIDGKILGFTKYFYEEVLQNNVKMNLSHQTTKDQNVLKITVKEFLNKNPLIQFYIPGIANQVQELRQQIVSSSNYLMNNLKSFWIIPNNHIECLQNSQLIFSQFKKRSYGSQQNFRSYKSQTYSKYSYNSINTQFDMQYDDSEMPSELKSNISINGIPILILHPEVEQQISKLVEITDSLSKIPQTGVFYSLQFKTLNFKRGNYGYFMLTIKDFKTIANQTINNQQTSRTQQSLYQTLIPSQEFSISNTKSPNSFFQDIRSENPDDSQYHAIQEIKQMNNNLKLNESSAAADNSFKFQLKQSDRSNLFDSSRQPLFARPKILEIDINEEVEQIELDMQVIKEIKQDQIEDEQDEGEKKVQSVSQSQKKSSNILLKFQTKQIKNKENDFASNPSRTSTNSTSKESLLIVQQLYHNTQLITPLKKIAVLLFIICSGILISNIINVQFISENLISQTNQLATLRQPQNINYFYTSEILQEWYLILIKNKLITLSPFMFQRNLDTLQGMYDYARTTQVNLAIIVPRLSMEQNLQTIMQTKFYQENSIVTIEYPLEEFYSILYQNTEISYRKFINNGSIDFPQLMPQGVVRLNLLDMLDFHNQLIEVIIENTIDKQTQVKSYFLSVMFGEMFSIFLIIGIQLKYWLFIDHIVKSILFLISRLNENQALDQMNRLSLIKEQLNNQINGNWKLFNFGDVMYGFSEKKAKKVILKSNVEIGQNNIKATSALYSRIQRTYYLNRINAFITFIITILLTVYLMAGFLLHMAKNDNFQPSLTVTLKFVQVRHNMDSLTLLAGLIKSEPIIPNLNLEYLNQTKACQLLIEYRDNLSPLINEVAQVILENANANNVKSRFDTILNYDLCLSSTVDSMPICDLSTIKLQYDQKDNYKSIISNGALGYTAALIKFINQEFDYEIQNLKYNVNETNKAVIQQQSFQNFILQYFTDIQTIMRQFLVLFQEDNLAIAQGIISVVQVYYYGVGTCLYLSYIILSIIWVYKSQMKIQSLRQVLVLIPPDHILTTNVRSQAKSIHQMLY